MTKSSRIPAHTVAMAERTVTLTLTQAQALPYMLGRICAAVLKHNGYYAVTVDGVKTLYIRQEHTA